MKSKNIIIIYVSFLALTLFSCGTSTGSRYNNEGGSAHKNEKIKSENEKKVSEYPENFNLAPYRAKITINDTAKISSGKNLNVWYNYHTQPDTGDVNRIVIKTAQGYRVQVLSTDNLDDANKMRSEIYFKTNQRAVYVIFDPPFYKVEVGDFTNISDARSLTFKFRQMGFADARVVNQTVNIFQ